LRISRLVHFGAVVASLASCQKTAVCEDSVLNLAWFGCALVRGYAALLRRAGAGRAQERPWKLGSHWRVSRPNWRSGRAHARTQKATRQHTGISRAVFGPRPCAIPQWPAAGGHEWHEAGGAGTGGRAERSDGDGNVRQVSGCRHARWRETPPVSRRSRHVAHWRLRPLVAFARSDGDEQDLHACAGRRDAGQQPVHAQ
jgi:hypothetical protein